MNALPHHLKVTSHTDYVGPGSTFVAVPGLKEDGRNYIPLALKKGAAHVVAEGTIDDSLKTLIDTHGAKLTMVTSARKALGALAAEAYGYPAHDLTLIGITGTKGKTTTAFLLEHILKVSGTRTALLGTVCNRIGDQEYQAPLTTPQPDYLHMFLAECKKRGVTHVVMEAAAQALSVNRLDELRFDAVIFTNFSLEHSEFYESQDEYYKAKCRLFDLVAPQGLVVLNADDERVIRCVPQWPNRHTISMMPDSSATYHGTLTESSLTSFALQVDHAGNSYSFSSSALLGTFSAYNLLAACAVSERYGIGRDDIQHALDTFTGVPGRIERFELPNNALAVIDNAHTPSSFEALFKAVRPLSSHIIAIFGAGGDRDPLKRPLMGAVAAQYADQIILTTDNPRSEKVEDIIAAIAGGINEELRHKVHIEPDRERAIRQAYTHMNEGSLLVLLGKGPVEYQHIQDKKIPFSEAKILRSLRS